MFRTVTAETSEVCSTQDLFTPEFKRLKARSTPLDLSGVIDLNKHDLTSGCMSSPVDKEIIPYSVRSCDLKPVAGLKPCKEWKCYKFSSYPGLIVVQNPFVDGYQRYWVHQCLQNFPGDKDNVTNLTALGDDGSRDLWLEFVRKKSCMFGKHDPLRKLRWTTLGYHYNWTTKEYSEDNKAPFPSDVNCLSQYFAACLGFAPYQAEAGIVNYYHMDSTLAGHTDHSEIDHSAPLFSISFGHTAVFMLGGHAKSVRPMAVLLRSGDVCVMSGESRLSYHAVPKILAPSAGEPPIPSSFNITSTPQCVKCDISTSAATTCGPCNCTCLNSGCGKLPGNTETYPVNISPESEDSHHRLYRKDLRQQDMAEDKTDKINLPDEEYVNFFINYDSVIDKINSRIDEVITSLDFSPFEVYLKSSRINLNIRQVLPSGWTKLSNKHQLEMSGSVSDSSNDGLCRKLIKRDIEDIPGSDAVSGSSAADEHDSDVASASTRHEKT